MTSYRTMAQHCPGCDYTIYGIHDCPGDEAPDTGADGASIREVAAAVYEAGGSLPPVPAPAYNYRATVVDNHDGDTITVDVHLGFEVTFTTNVRLLGMNARELSAPGGKEARDNLRALLPPGTVVTLSSEKVDKYGGRYDATVTYLGADGQPHDLVGDLVAQQWGAPYGGSGPMPVPPWPRTVPPQVGDRRVELTTQPVGGPDSPVRYDVTGRHEYEWDGAERVDVCEDEE